MIVYFTGTGNSRYAAQALADVLGDERVDTRPFLKNGEKLELRSERPWVFVCPTYAWRIPRVFRELIEKGLFVGNRRAYFVMTCGDSIGRADEEIARLCGRKGFSCMGVMPVVMPGIVSGSRTRKNTFADDAPRSCAASITEGLILVMIE